MEEVHVAKGETIIRQGEEGHHFYLVDSGTLDCFVKSDDPANQHFETASVGGSEDSSTGARVLEYTAGSTFGELALMYNAPRAASVVATSDAALWAMERKTFSSIVMQTMSQKRAHLHSLLGAVPLLQGLDAYERQALADLFEERTFKAGEKIVLENDDGDAFFLIAHGSAEVSKMSSSPGGRRRKIVDIKEGDYFGELALLNNTKRAATVEATTEVKVVSLDRKHFQRMTNPLIEILRRNAEGYNKIRPLDESARNSVTPLLSSTRDEEEEEEGGGGGNAHV